MEKKEQSGNYLEYQLEIGRHEDLRDQKKRTDSQLNKFTTDGCSGGLSVGWEYLAENIDTFRHVHGAHPPWEICCIAHDRAYHSGGDREISEDQSFELRRTADQQLRDCVFQTAAERAEELSAAYGISEAEVARLYSVIAGLMYRAVRIGGMPCTGLPWRWGYGWPQCQGN